MKPTMRTAGLLGFLVLLSGCDPVASEDSAPGAIFADWYPANTSPPAGTAYPCAFTPMPKTLDGIPPSHHRFLNHVCSLLVKAIHQRLLAHQALAAGNGAGLETYLAATRELQKKIRDEEAPSSMRAFRDDLVAGLEGEMTAYGAAFAARRSGNEAIQALGAAPGGREASGRLISAWQKMEARYPKWTPDVKNSLYHHLCALDIF